MPRQRPRTGRSNRRRSIARFEGRHGWTQSRPRFPRRYVDRPCYRSPARAQRTDRRRIGYSQRRRDSTGSLRPLLAAAFYPRTDGRGRVVSSFFWSAACPNRSRHADAGCRGPSGGIRHAARLRMYFRTWRVRPRPSIAAIFGGDNHVHAFRHVDRVSHEAPVLRCFC